jgi:dsRNA-specific ribonuclease
METKGILAMIVGCIVGLLALIWGVQGNDFFMYKVFAPKYEQVRRQTFEETKSYRQGMIQELQNMQFEYEKTNDKSAKDRMASIILHRSADFPEADMPSDLRSFISGLRIANKSTSKY